MSNGAPQDAVGVEVGDERPLAPVARQALLDSIHIDINNEGFDDEDMEEQMGEEDAAARAADEMVEGFWA